MNVSAPSIPALMAKIRALPTDRIAEVDDFVDFLKARSGRSEKAPHEGEALDFPVDHLGAWPADLTLRREDLYGDDGR